MEEKHPPELPDLNWIATHHAVDRFRERGRGVDKTNARVQLVRTLDLAKPTGRTTKAGGALWELPGFDAYAIVHEDHGVRIVVTVFGKAQVDGAAFWKAPLTSAVLAEQLVMATEERAAADAALRELEAAIKAKEPDRVPAEYWAACQAVMANPGAALRLVQVAQAETGRVREAEKSWRHAFQQDADTRYAEKRQALRDLVGQILGAESRAAAYDLVLAGPFAHLVEGLPRPPEQVDLETNLRMTLMQREAELGEARARIAELEALQTTPGVQTSASTSIVVHHVEPGPELLAFLKTLPQLVESKLTGAGEGAAQIPPSLRSTLADVERLTQEVAPPANVLLKAHRLRLGRSQGEMALRLGVSQSYLSDLERGRRPVSADLLARARRVRPSRKK